jgi:hypothetical protein
VSSFSCLFGFPFFLGPNNIPLHVYTTVSLSIHPLMDIQAVFYILAIVNKAADSNSFGYMPGNGIKGLLDYMAILILTV